MAPSGGSTGSHSRCFPSFSPGLHDLRAGARSSRHRCAPLLRSLTASRSGSASSSLGSPPRRAGCVLFVLPNDSGPQPGGSDARGRMNPPLRQSAGPVLTAVPGVLSFPERLPRDVFVLFAYPRAGKCKFQLMRQLGSSVQTFSSPRI